ncbi:MAG TPA: PIN domain-containing protein [Thermoanaerobaculia bacterium]|nr:PIN domain-containing protein [Thermoanaerobaculia bacterium]
MVIADTGFWLALANRTDRHHERAVECAERFPQLVTTWPVLTETCHVLLTRLGAASQQAFVRSVAAGACELFDLQAEHLAALPSLMDKYADLPMDLADASLVLLAGELGHGRILSTDRRDFGAYRWKQHEPFENLLLG